MEGERTLDELRLEIDRINREMAALFIERLEVSEEIAEVKRARGLAVEDAAREERIIESVRALSETYPDELEALFRTLFQTSKAVQRRRTN